MQTEGTLMRGSRRFTRTALATAAASVALGAPSQAAAADNAVVHWNEFTAKTVLADSKTATPSASSLYVAIAQAAVYNASMAIEGTFQPYRSSLQAPAAASEDAAVAAAAYGVLSAYFGDGAAADHGGASQQASLDAAYQESLAAIPDGQSKDDGIDLGRAAAAEMIALRTGDGRFALVPEPPDGDAPGEWRRTAGPASVTPWTAQVRPFTANSPDQFRTEGPNAVTSADYAAQLDETRRYGAKTGSARSPEQTEIARFWTENTLGQYNRALRGLANTRGLSTGQSARLFAMTALTGADGMITCWNNKFHYLAWRPVTAIREADTDGNPATTADPTWEPLSTTANHPEYTSGHACLTGAVTRALGAFLGTDSIDLTMDSTATGTNVHRFATVNALRREVENARIYGGDHFRKGGSDGTQAGDHVAKWALKRYFQRG
jgi:hypothetical protein